MKISELIHIPGFRSIVHQFLRHHIASQILDPDLVYFLNHRESNSINTYYTYQQIQTNRLFAELLQNLFKKLESWVILDGKTGPEGMVPQNPPWFRFLSYEKHFSGVQKPIYRSLQKQSLLRTDKVGTVASFSFKVKKNALKIIIHMYGCPHIMWRKQKIKLSHTYFVCV